MVALPAQVRQLESQAEISEERHTFAGVVVVPGAIRTPLRAGVISRVEFLSGACEVTRSAGGGGGAVPTGSRAG